jgi:hypothetical protein
MFPTSLKINQKFGGEFPTAKNVFYSDFSDDPWQRASVSFSANVDSPYYLTTCENCGHCKDFHTPSESDPVELKNERIEFQEFLRTVLV